MDSNTYSTQAAGGGSVGLPDRPPLKPPVGPPVGQPDDLAALTTDVDDLAALTADLDALTTRDLDGLCEVVRAERVLALRQLADRLEGQWLKELAGVDAQGAAGAEQDQQPGSTTAWLRQQLRMGADAARSAVRTARALFCGPLTGTAQALVDGVISPAHARVLADGTHDLPPHLAAEAEPVLLELAGKLDPPRLRQAVAHLRQVVDPEGAGQAAERRHARRGLWLSPTFDGMVAVDGLLEPEAGNTVMAALEPLARPADADDPRLGGQRTADALTELARRALEAGRLPQTGGVRPQLLVTVDLDSLTGHPGGIGGEAGWAGPLEPETCRRLACDGAVTRVLVTRHPSSHQPAADHLASGAGGHPDHGPDHGPDPSGDRGASGPSGEDGLQGRLQAAMALLPPVLGGAPRQPLEVGRATRVVQPAQRMALAVRDGGCVFPGCDRPLAWCDAHHLWHWVHGGPTDLDNLALLCRAHHRAVHEGGWRLARGPDGRFGATPPHRRHHPAA
jgi:hypothetical protein